MPPQTHVVRRGDTPASIAITHAGCPKCSRDLIASNPHKKTVVYPNGFKTFKDLREGEELKLPQKWFSAAFDRLPPTYFAALPRHDGVTPSKLGVGAAGVLGDFATLDSATAAVAALLVLDNQSFNASMPGAASLVDQSVREADGSVNPAVSAYAQATHIGTSFANAQNADLTTALASNDQAGGVAARGAAQTALSTALESAQMAVQAVYGGSPPSPSGGPAQINSPALIAAAQAVVAAISSNPSFCTLVSQPGTAVNTAVHAFKLAWNTANPGNPVPVDTGNYEQATANVLATILGSAPPACASVSVPSQPVPPSSSPPLLVQAPAQSSKLSTGAIVGLGALGVGLAGGMIYVVTRR